MTEILYEALDGVATVTLNRPDRLNAWTGAMASGLREAMARAEADPAVKAIILTGAGRGFCAGADMGMLQDISASGESESRAFAPFDPTARPDYQHPQTWLAAVSKPIVAAINGPAAGMGLCLSLFCDLRFAADSAIFVSAFSRRGLIAEHGTSWMLTRLVGHSRAMDIMLSSRRVSAAEAYRMGLADRVVAAHDLMAEARAYARDLAENVSPRSMAVIKRQLWNGLLQGLAEAMTDADREMALSLKSDDFKEGVAHFVEKRPARFPAKV
ncbi:enoyl-CoA hydratase [Phenylobacterium sp.]|uniref:enoyl-CoA hydratase n=1 Tax=Phenylobacterium sp. TaxID=1871053 RepID=UPI0025E50755|nr:enoyl-CoA hydratase [Phenylobacterium sp.]